MSRNSLYSLVEPGGLRVLGEADAALEAGPGVASAAAVLLVLGERLL